VAILVVFVALDDSPPDAFNPGPGLLLGAAIQGFPFAGLLIGLATAPICYVRRGWLQFTIFLVVGAVLLIAINAWPLISSLQQVSSYNARATKGYELSLWVFAIKPLADACGFVIFALALTATRSKKRQPA
jgi:hypothetical protein